MIGLPPAFAAIVRSGSIYSLSTLVNALVRFAILSIGARVLLLEDYGALDTILFVGLVFSSLIIMGFDSAILRLAFDEDEDTHHPARLLTTALALIGANGLLFTALFALSVTVVDYSALRLEDGALLVCFVFFGLGFSLVAASGAHMRARFQETRFLAATSISAFIRIGVLMPFLVMGETSLPAFLMTVAGAYFASGLVFVAFNRRWLSHEGLDTSLMRQLISFGVPLGGVVVMAGTYPLLERLIVLTVGDHVWLAIYAASAFPAMVLGVAIQVVNLAWVPLALKAQKDGKENFVPSSALLLQAGFIALYLFVLVFAEPIVRLLAPIDIEDPARLFPFIGMIMLVRFSAALTSFGFIVKKRTGVKLIINSAGFAAGALASLLAGERYGVGAIPVALFLTTFAVFVVEALVARRIAPQLVVPYPPMALVIILTGGIAFWSI